MTATQLERRGNCRHTCMSCDVRTCDATNAKVLDLTLCTTFPAPLKIVAWSGSGMRLSSNCLYDIIIFDAVLRIIAYIYYHLMKCSGIPSFHSWWLCGFYCLINAHMYITMNCYSPFNFFSAPWFAIFDLLLLLWYRPWSSLHCHCQSYHSCWKRRTSVNSCLFSGTR